MVALVAYAASRRIADMIEHRDWAAVGTHVIAGTKTLTFLNRDDVFSRSVRLQKGILHYLVDCSGIDP